MVCIYLELLQKCYYLDTTESMAMHTIDVYKI